MFNTKKIIKYSLSVILLSMVISLIPIASSFNLSSAKAQNWLQTVNKGGLDEVGKVYGGAPRDIRMIVVDIIKVILGFLGIIATVIILYAGFKWMTSQGNEEEVSTAKKMLTAGVIGLVVILSAYALATFTISYLVGATTGTPVLWQ